MPSGGDVIMEFDMRSVCAKPIGWYDVPARYVTRTYLRRLREKNEKPTSCAVRFWGTSGWDPGDKGTDPLFEHVTGGHKPFRISPPYLLHAKSGALTT